MSTNGQLQVLQPEIGYGESDPPHHHSFFVTGVTPVTSHLSRGSARVAYFVTGVAVTGVRELKVQDFAFWHLCHGVSG